MTDRPKFNKGDLVSYRGSYAIVITINETPGWMDKIEVLYPNGTSDWYWEEELHPISHLTQHEK
jgi:hypothetical protein